MHSHTMCSVTELFIAATQASSTVWLKTLSLLAALIIVHMNTMHHIRYMQLSIFCPRVINCGNPKLDTPLAKLWRRLLCWL